MLALLNFFWDLCLFRAKPQDAPASQVLFLLTLMANLAAGVLILTDAFGGPVAALLAALMDNLLLLLMLGLLLRWRGWLPRFRQVGTALLGSGTILCLIAYPLQATVSVAQGQPSQGAWAALLLLLVMVWIHLVMGHILRHALEIPFAGGVLLAVLFSMISTLLVQGLFIPVH